MPVSRTAKEAFKEKLLTIQPQSFVSGYVHQLDRLFEAAQDWNTTIDVKSWWENPYQTYQYVFKYRMAEYMLHDLSKHNELFVAQATSDLRTGGLCFAIANWLDWNNEYDLHKRYNSTTIDLTATSGWVLKHPLPILGAAAASSNAYLSEVIHLVDMPFRKEATQLAANAVRSKYGEDVMPKSDMEDAMHAAHLSLNDIAGCKINGYPLD